MTTSIEDTPSSVFVPLIASYARVRKDLQALIDTKMICADSFRGRPSSWMIVGSGNRPRSADPDVTTTATKPPPSSTPKPSPGWLKLLDSSKSLREFAPQLSEKICMYFAFEGHQCKRDPCPFKHLSGLNQLAKGDQVILNKYILEHPNQFAVIQPQGKKPGVSTKRHAPVKKG